MNRLRLILPMPEHKEMIMDYKREFLKNGDSMDGTAGLKNAETYEEWYSSFCNNLNEETVEDGLVPATTYMAISNYENILISHQIQLLYNVYFNYIFIWDIIP